MDMEQLSALIKMYAEVGILVICALMFIVLAISVFKKNDKHTEVETNRVDNTNEVLIGLLKESIKTIQNQNDELVRNMKDNNEKLIGKIVDQVSTHTLSPEESSKQNEIDTKIMEIIHDIRLETRARRCGLIRYHNGGRGVNGQAFLKMSMTHEDLSEGTESIYSDLKDQFRSMLTYFVSETDKAKTCYIQHRDDIKNRDMGSYQFMAERDMESLFGISVSNEAGYPLGLVFIEFATGTNVDIVGVNESLKNHIDQITELMNRKVHNDL